MNIKKTIKRIPIIGPTIPFIYHFFKPPKPFSGSQDYWIVRYDNNGNSGDGSYNQLAEFKAETLNAFVVGNRIESVIEFGCGDGNQLRFSDYPMYLGFDVSINAIDRCLELFLHDKTKTFKLMDDYNHEKAELTLSLDVIYHLVEDEVFEDYMNKLFDSSTKYVVIYSSNHENNSTDTAAHVRHRNFTRWVTEHQAAWELLKHIPNRHPFDGDNKTGSFADFYVYGFSDKNKL